MLAKNAIEAATAAATSYPNDVNAATTAALARIKKLPNYAEVVEELLRDAVQELIYDIRHRKNVQLKKQEAAYGGPSKVPSRSPAVRRVHQSLYEYHIAGRTLGDIRGAELETIADHESKTADGHRWNAWLCRELARTVPDDKTVRESVSKKKLQALFKRATEATRAA